MVNVNQPLPFNLHNRPAYGRTDRSLSANTTPPRPTSSTNPSPDSPSAAAYPNQHAPSYTPSREPSPSIQTSRSASSLHPGDASYLPPESDPENGARRPILNARIVRGVGGFTVGGGRVGRSTTRGRTGRFGDDRIQPLTSSQDIGNSTNSAAANSAAEPSLEAGTSILSGSKSGDEEAAPGTDLTPKAPYFRFADAAKISCSFGD